MSIHLIYFYKVTIAKVSLNIVRYSFCSLKIKIKMKRKNLISYFQRQFDYSIRVSYFFSFLYFMSCSVMLETKPI